MSSNVAESTLNAFLLRSHKRLREVGVASSQPVHVVIGNEAADPDSCVCAIALAAALDAYLADEGALVVPLIQVPRADFKLQLDRVHLLRRAGLAGSGEGPLWTPTHVNFIDEVGLHEYAPSRLNIHLVDHNKLSAPLAHLAPCVRSIIDHHAEEGLYTDSVVATGRVVELGIGSCASLVAEHLQAIQPSLLSDPVVCSLLLGAIVLDTVNLDPAAKAQKAREASVSDAALLPVAAPLLGIEPTPQGRAAFFDELLRVKADTRLLVAFPTGDLVRQDYKEEELLPSGVRAGVGSIVLPLPQLLARQPAPTLAAEMEAFGAARSLRLLLLMAVDLSQRQRYLLLYAEEEAVRAAALAALEACQLSEMAIEGADAQSSALLAFRVGDYSVSRKVLLPRLRGLALSAL